MDADVSVQVPDRVLDGLCDGRMGAFLVSARGRDWLTTGGRQGTVWLRTSTGRRLQVRVLGSKVVQKLDVLPAIAVKLDLVARDLSGNKRNHWEDVRRFVASSGLDAPYLLVRAVPVSEIVTKPVKPKLPEGVTVITDTHPTPQAHFLLHNSSIRSFRARLDDSIAELALAGTVQQGAEAVADALTVARTCWVGEKTRKTARQSAGAQAVRWAVSAMLNAGVLVQREHGGPVVARRILNGLWATHVRVIDSTAPAHQPPAWAWVYRNDTPLNDAQIQIHEADEGVYRDRLTKAVTAAAPPAALGDTVLSVVEAVATGRRSFLGKRAHARIRHGRGNAIVDEALGWLEATGLLGRVNDTWVVQRRLVAGLRMASKPATLRGRSANGRTGVHVQHR